LKTLHATFAVALTCTILATAPAGAAENVPDREGVEVAFDRQKGKIYGAYARALREQPQLKGRIDLEFTLGTDGRASRCRVVRSELGSPPLEAELCKVVEGMDFGPRSAPATIVKRIDFYPAA
jgi:TonB family protein